MPGRDILSIDPAIDFQICKIYEGQVISNLGNGLDEYSLKICQYKKGYISGMWNLSGHTTSFVLK